VICSPHFQQNLQQAQQHLQVLYYAPQQQQQPHVHFAPQPLPPPPAQQQQQQPGMMHANVGHEVMLITLSKVYFFTNFYI
jgi:hypothetical protein